MNEKEMDKMLQNELLGHLDEYGITYIPFNLLFTSRVIFINEFLKLRPNIDSVDGDHFLYFYDIKSVEIEKYREIFQKFGSRRNMSDGSILGVLSDIRKMAKERNCSENDIIKEVFG